MACGVSGGALRLGGGKFSKGKGYRRLALLSTTMLGAVWLLGSGSSALAEGAQPSGGAVVAGSAVISTPSSSQTLITQSSGKAIIDWNSFSIGQGQSVQFNNGSGATLNRVTGTSTSSLDGLLSATGSVYLINGNGVVIGKSGVIKTGGTFVASTLDVTNANFLTGGDLTFAGTSTASVINLGKVGALGGDVALIAAQVDNDGTLTAAQGTVGLAAGQTVVMRDQALDDGQFLVQVGGAGTSVTNTGTIEGASAELRANGGNIYALAGNGSGLIAATGVKTQDGHVWLTAGDGGHLTVASALSAQQASGDGGEVETSGGTVDFTGARIDTTGTTGKTGTWLIDPYDLTVDTAAASTLSGNLATTNVTLQTTASGTAGPGTANPSGVGDITINAAITWSSANTLTLNAYHGINILAPITVTGAGKVTLLTNQGGTGGDYSFGLGPSGFAGGLSFTGTPNSGQSLKINGNNYNLIYSMSDLESISSSYSALAKTLDASAKTYNSSVVQASFGGVTNSYGDLVGGVFTGLGNRLDNVNINASSTNPSFTGVFAYSYGTIRDIGLQGGSINTSITTPAFYTVDVGMLVAVNSGTIKNAYSTNSVTAFLASDAFAEMGGLVGHNNAGGTISNSYVTGNISLDDGGKVTTGGYSGGLVGHNEGSLSDVYANGSLNTVVNSNETGGLVGRNQGTITRAYATGAIVGRGSNTALGGLAGTNYSGILDNVFASGAVTGNSSFTGGLVGLNYQGTVRNAYATGSVRSTVNYGTVGGVIGTDISGTISAVFGTGYLASTGSFGVTGGAIGNVSTTTVSSAYYDSQTTGKISGSQGDVSVGLFTSALQGTLPTGFDPSVWGTGTGLYPYLKSFYPTGVQAFSGFVYWDAGLAFASGKGVSLLSNGQLIGSTSTGANGYYYIMAPTGTVASGSNNLLANTTDAASLINATGAVSQSGINLYFNTLAGSTTDMALSSARPDLVAAALGQAGSNTGATSAITGASGLWLTSTSGNGFVVDQAQNISGLFVINNSVGAITLSSAVTVLIGGTFSLLSGTSDVINANVTVKGSSSVNLMTASASNRNLIFGATNSIIFENADGSAATSNQGGRLTIANHTYQLLYSLSDVAGVNYGTGYYALANTLDGTGTSFSSSLVGTLNGTFEGLGNSLNHLTIYGADTFTGVFGIVNASGTVKDLTVNTSLITSSGYSLGGLVGYNNGGTLTYVNAFGNTVTGGGNTHVGGLAGYNTGTVYVASSSGTISGSGQFAGIGGLVGWNTGSVSFSSSTAALSGTASNAFDGGLIGVNNGGVVSNNSTSGSVSANGWAVGGMVGYNLGTVALDTASGSVTGTGSLSFIGGLAGVNASGDTVSSSSASTTVSGTGFAFGGLVGYNQGTLSSDTSSGSVTGTGNSYVGGLAGFNLGTVATGTASGTISSDGTTSQVGGLIGQNFSGSVTGSNATGNVTATGANSFAGGLIGVNKTTVSTSSASGNVTGSGFAAGGLVGWNEASLTSVKYTIGTVTGNGSTDTGGLVGYNLAAIDQAYSSGTVIGLGTNIGIGGLVGWNNAGTLSNVYATGSVTGGNAFIGGLTGVNFANITYALATGQVTGTGSFTGGLTGFNSGTILDGYYDAQTTGQATGTQGNGSQGLTTATLKATLPQGFAANIWGQNAGQYPTLNNVP